MEQVVQKELGHIPRTLSGQFSFPTAQAKNLQTVLQKALQLFRQNLLEDALVILQNPLSFVGPYKLMVTEALGQVHQNKAHMLQLLRRLPLHRLNVLECLSLFKRQLLPTLTERLNDLIAPREQFCRLRYHDLVVAKLFMFTSTVHCKMGQNRLALSTRLTALKACCDNFVLTRNPQSRLLAIDNVFSLGRILCLGGNVSRGALYFLFYSLSAPTFSQKCNGKRKQALKLLRRQDQSVEIVHAVLEKGPTMYADAILAYCRAHKCPSTLVWLPNQTSSPFVDWILQMHHRDMGSDVWPWSGVRERKMISQKLQFVPPEDYCALQALFQESFVLLREHDLEVQSILSLMADMHRNAARYDAELPLRRRVLQNTWIRKHLFRTQMDLMGPLADIARCQAHVLYHRHAGKNHELATAILEISDLIPTGLELVVAYCSCCVGKYRQSAKSLCLHLEKCTGEDRSPLTQFVIDMLTRKNYI